MAIKQEHVTVNGVDFVKTYSDAGRYVVGGEPFGEYDEATDPAEYNRQYVEGDLIPQSESDIEAKAEAYDILMGVSE